MSEYDPSYDDTSTETTDTHTADPLLGNLEDLGIGDLFGGHGDTGHEPGYDPSHEPGGYDPEHEPSGDYDPSGGHEPGGVVGPTGGGDNYNYAADSGDSYPADGDDTRAAGADGTGTGDGSDSLSSI